MVLELKGPARPLLLAILERALSAAFHLIQMLRANLEVNTGSPTADIQELSSPDLLSLPTFFFFRIFFLLFFPLYLLSWLPLIL